MSNNEEQKLEAAWIKYTKEHRVFRSPRGAFKAGWAAKGEWQGAKLKHYYMLSVERANSLRHAEAKLAESEAGEAKLLSLLETVKEHTACEHTRKYIGLALKALQRSGDE